MFSGGYFTSFLIISFSFSFFISLQPCVCGGEGGGRRAAFVCVCVGDGFHVRVWLCGWLIVCVRNVCVCVGGCACVSLCVGVWMCMCGCTCVYFNQEQKCCDSRPL